MTKSNFLLTILAMAFAASANAADLSKLEPVKAFYADASHCMYMVDNPGEASDAVGQRFSKAVESAVAAMLKADPSMSLDKALTYLRKGCNATLQAAAK